MAEAELLQKVKSGLGITGDYQDDTLQVYIDEVKAFMIAAGVRETIVDSSAAVGCIMKGVNDLMNLSPSDSRFSDYFMMRLVQLATTPGDD